MRKINLADYQVDGKPYHVAGTIATLLFNPELKLSARDLMSQDALAKKVETAGDSVLLEEAEYQKIKQSVDMVKGWMRGDLEFVSRVLDATEVPVKEA